MSIYDQREVVTIEIEKLKRLKGNDESIMLENDIEMFRLQNKNDFLNQRLDSHYELLLGWNRVWQTVMFMGQFEEKVTRYVGFKHEERRKDIEANIQLLESKIKEGQSVGEFTNGDFATELERAKQDLKKETLRHELSRARNKMFLTQLSSAFVLGALQIYFLPLLYGLLGAATFVLRTLSTEIKTLTYSYDSEIRFRLRLSLGALAGMAVGWFLKPDSVSGLVSLSPMALAFLMGYNVEVLFSIMDKFIEVISKWTPDAQKSPATKEKAAK